MYFANGREHTIPLFIAANIMPVNILYCESIASPGGAGGLYIEVHMHGVNHTPLSKWPTAFFFTVSGRSVCSFMEHLILSTPKCLCEIAPRLTIGQH